MTRRYPAYGGARRRGRRSDKIEVHATDPYHDATMLVHTVEAVKYSWPEWYTKVVLADERILHWGPWRTQWAARQAAHILARLFSQRDQLTGGVRVQS